MSLLTITIIYNLVKLSLPPSLPPSPPSSLLPYNSYYLGIAVILMFPYFKFDQSIRHSTGHNPQSTPHNTHTQQ